MNNFLNEKQICLSKQNEAQEIYQNALKRYELYTFLDKNYYQSGFFIFAINSHEIYKKSNFNEILYIQSKICEKESFCKQNHDNYFKNFEEENIVDKVCISNFQSKFSD